MDNPFDIYNRHSKVVLFGVEQKQNSLRLSTDVIII